MNVAIKAWRWIFISLLLFIVLVIFIRWMNPNQNEQDLKHINKLTTERQEKKVILLMVDSLMSKYINNGLEKKELPAFKYLIDHGQYYQKLVSSFPTMSISIDSTLLTGTYPNKHKVPGLVWFSNDEKRLINYGSGTHEMITMGLNNTVDDFIINLNQSHLSTDVSTIYESLDRLHISTGSINGLIYRGHTKHELSIPSWAYGPTTLPPRISVNGPDFLSLGALSNPLSSQVKLPENISKKLGFNNDFSTETLKYLIQRKQLPDFTYVYLPDLDIFAHENPDNMNMIKEVDTRIKKILDSFDSWDDAIKNNIFIIMGDSGQTKINSYLKNPIIPIQNLFKGYKIYTSGKDIPTDTEVVAATNERMAYIYPLTEEVSIPDLVSKAQKNSNIDVVAYKEGKWIHVKQGGSKKELKYTFGKELVDPYGQEWLLEGDYNVLDIKVDKNNKKITYGQFPDPLIRLEGALFSHSGDFVIITAKPGYEFVGQASPLHTNGGAHGSLHETDSLVPIIIIGTDESPKYWRIKDIKPFIIKLLYKE